MSAAGMDRESFKQLVNDTLLGSEFRRATFGGTIRGGVPCPWLRVVVRPVELRGVRHLQFSYFDAKKDVTKNAEGAEAAARIGEMLEFGFTRIHVATRSEEIDISTSKKGKIFIGRRAVSAPDIAPAHNRVKDVPLPEGRADRVLETMGVLTRTGHVRPAMRAKYTQINEFLKQVQHTLDAAGLRALGRPVEILDCGCGASYLTLAAHHYLNDVLGIPANITGVDVNEDVIRKSLERADRLGVNGLRFACGTIEASRTQPDIVVALHACDTATDDALAQAVFAEARLILSVPCCHHELNRTLRPEGPAAALRPLFRHGILKQRMADLTTDAFRALALRIVGYQTDVVEFISPEHTSRNLMIRAVRGVPVGEAVFVDEYLAMRRFWGATPYIERALGERFTKLLSNEPDSVGSGYLNGPA